MALAPWRSLTTAGQNGQVFSVGSSIRGTPTSRSAHFGGGGAASIPSARLRHGANIRQQQHDVLCRPK
jgi:hypothetical protein